MKCFRDIPLDEKFHYICILRHNNGVLIEVYAEKRKCAERMEEIVRESINSVGCDVHALRQAIKMMEYTKKKK